MVVDLVCSLLAMPSVTQIIITKNIPEKLDLPADSRILVIKNPTAKGFGANHNAAFKYCQQPFFCPINPDIKLKTDPFPYLTHEIKMTASGLVAPIVLTTQGKVEDSIRYFPTPWSILRKALGGGDGRYQVAPDMPSFQPEWVAGMFMLFRSASFRKLGGFDEAYFLYYEDVDICTRALHGGIKITACPKVSITHDAQRRSHKNLTHLYWHISSMLKYFWKYWITRSAKVNSEQ